MNQEKNRYRTLLIKGFARGAPIIAVISTIAGMYHAVNKIQNDNTAAYAWWYGLKISLLWALVGMLLFAALIGLYFMRQRYFSR